MALDEATPLGAELGLLVANVERVGAGGHGHQGDAQRPAVGEGRVVGGGEGLRGQVEVAAQSALLLLQENGALARLVEEDRLAPADQLRLVALVQQNVLNGKTCF